MNTVDGPHDLTPLQRKYLQSLWQDCRRTPTLAGIYRKLWRSYLFLFLFLGMLVWLCIEKERIEIAWMVGGMGLGTVVRDHRYFRLTIQFWPATVAVIDQKALAVLIHEDHSESENW
ncbi:MAG TPA: hypothetical protein VGL71_10670 [Urbifossiella sp.]|jgi:hypothetical protein